MIRPWLLLLTSQCAGELARQALHLPISGPVLGMVLLLLALCAAGGPSADLKSATSGLLSYLAILFVPAGVGIVAYRHEFAQHAFLVLLSLVGSSALAIVATALIGQAALRFTKRYREPSAAEAQPPELVP